MSSLCIGGTCNRYYEGRRYIVSSFFFFFPVFKLHCGGFTFFFFIQVMDTLTHNLFTPWKYCSIPPLSDPLGWNVLQISTAGRCPGAQRRINGPH